MKKKLEGKHTPTPWHHETRRGPNSQQVTFRPSTDDDNWGWAKIEGMNAEANAAFIVRAVNSHEALLDIAKAMLAFVKQDPQSKDFANEIGMVIAQAEKVL